MQTRTIEPLQVQDSVLIQRAHKVSFGILIIVGLMTLVCLAGWAFDQIDMKRLFLGPRMLLRSSTALGLFLSSAAIACLQVYQMSRDEAKKSREDSVPPWAVLANAKQTSGRKLSKAEFRSNALLYSGISFALIIFLAGLATLVETLSGQDFGLDFQLYSPSEDSSGITFPGPMPANVSINFLFLSLALIFSQINGPKTQWIWQIAAFISLALALFAFFGFLCGVDTLCTMFGCVRMPTTISVPFVLLSTAIFCGKPEAESTKILITNSLGGRIARRFLAFLLAIPLCLIARDAGVSIKLFDAAFGWVIFGMLVLASLIGVVVWSARSLDTLESARQKALARQVESEERLEKTERKLTSELARQIAQNTGQQPVARMRNVCLTCTKEYAMDLKRCPDDNERLMKLADNSLVGTVFADKYFIVEEVGSGGMATVFKARHLFLEHKVFAVKVMTESISASSVNVKRFQSEARTASRLEHPNLIKIHDFGVTRQGQPYLLMDFISGQSLFSLIDECKRLDLTQFEDIFSQVLDGIAAAHSVGIIHRDLKPANIMLVEHSDGRTVAQIVDFGIAKESGKTDAKLTKTGEVCGSPLYMSPEQWEGKVLDARSDIYAIGCVMYECLVGIAPFQKDSLFEILQAHLLGEIPEIPKSVRIPEHIQAAIKSCLAKSPDERPQSASELKERIMAKRMPHGPSVDVAKF